MADNKWTGWSKTTPPVDGAFATSKGWEIPLAGTNPADQLTEVLIAMESTTPEAVAPTQASRATVPTTGNIVTGANFDINVTFSEKVFVTGTPRIPVYANDGTTLVGYANYSAGKGTKVLRFRLVVPAGTVGTGVKYGANIALNSGTIKDPSGNNAVLTFAQATTTVTFNV